MLKVKVGPGASPRHPGGQLLVDKLILFKAEAPLLQMSQINADTDRPQLG